MSIIKSLWTVTVRDAVKALVIALIGAVLERAISILDAFGPVTP